MDDQSDRLAAAPSAALRAGLGEYLAQDLKHNRKVAVKVLPARPLRQ